MSIRDHFYRLASNVGDERIEAATALISDLIKEDQREDWEYALNRLVKGVASTKQSARFGFSMALTEILRELFAKKTFDISIARYVELLQEATEVKSNMKGKEERALLFGRLFGLQALVNSGVLLDSNHTDLDQLVSFVDTLVSLSLAKSWLRETSIFTLCEFIKLLMGTKLPKDEVVVEILQKVNDNGLNYTTEGVAIYLTIPKDTRVLAAAKIKSPKNVWKNWDPLSRGNLDVLSKVLKDSVAVDDENQKQKGSWLPKVSFVWDLIVQEFTQKRKQLQDEDKDVPAGKKRKASSSAPNKKQKVNETTLKEFWKVVIDETFFAEKSSHERKFWGFEIFKTFLNAVAPEEVPFLFTNNFLRTLINQSSQNQRLLNKSAISALNDIIKVGTSTFIKAPFILSSLLDEKNGGCWNFDLVTKSKTIDKLISTLNQQDTTQVIEVEFSAVTVQIKDILFEILFKAVADQGEETEHFKGENDQVIKWALDKILLLSRSLKPDAKTKTLFEDIFKLLIKLAFFKKSSGNVSPNIRQICQERINSVLTDVINTAWKKSSWPYYCLKSIVKLELSGKYETLVNLDDELLSVKNETLEFLDTIQNLLKSNTKSSTEDQLRCFEMLFSMVFLQLYMGDPEAVMVFDEIRVCFNDVFAKDETEENIDSSVILTEILLSFLSKKSSLLKKLSISIWKSFLCKVDEDTEKLRVTEESLNLLYDVFNARENSAGLKTLFDAEEEQDEDEEEEKESDEEDKDKEEDDKEDTEDEDEDVVDTEEEQDEDEDDDDEEQDDDDENSETVDKETNLKLASALGIPTEESGEVNFNDLESESEESDSMDDDQMMAIDQQLSRIFKERRSALSQVSTGNKRKAEATDAKEQVTLLKNRVLDLLETLAKLVPNSYLVLTMVKPLVNVIGLTADKNLSHKAQKLLKRISKSRVTENELKIYYSPKEIAQFKESLLSSVQLIQDLLLTSKSPGQDFNLACSQGSMILSKNLVNLESDSIEKIIDIYSSSLKQWALTKKSKVQPSFLFDFINWLKSRV